MHLDHKSSLDTSYWNLFEETMRENLCNKQSYFSNTS